MSVAPWPLHELVQSGSNVNQLIRPLAELHAEQQALQTLARQIRMPDAALASWLTTYHHPFGAFVLFYLTLIIHTALSALQYFLGSVDFPLTLRLICVSGGAVLSGTAILLLGLCFCFGPGMMSKEPRLKPFVFIWVLAPAAFAVYHACNHATLVPYQSRFAFLLTLSVIVTCRNMFAMLSFLPVEHGPPTTPPLMILFRAGLRSVRFIDSVSDTMFVEVLFEKV